MYRLKSKGASLRAEVALAQSESAALKSALRKTVLTLNAEGLIEVHGHIRPGTACVQCRDLIELAKLAGITLNEDGIFTDLV